MASQKPQTKKGITVEFINCTAAGAKMERETFPLLVKLAKLNKATRLLLVFDRG